MVNKSVDPPETIDCTGKECECAIPVVDCFYVHNAEVPQIGTKCPECGKVAALSKTKTIAYMNAYPAIQQGIDSAIGFRAPEPDEHESLADRVLRLLDVYGYTQSKWTSAKKITRQLIEGTPGPHTASTINEILTSRTIKPVDAFQIANLAVGGENQSAMGVSGIFTAQQQFQPPYMYPQTTQPQMPYQPPMQQPAYQNPQQMQPQIPYQQPIGQPQIPYQQPPAQPNDDGITIVEKLGEDGQVIERVIKQPKPVAEPTNGTAPQANMIEQFKEMIAVMEGAGMIRGAVEPEPQPTVEEIIEHIVPLIAKPEPATDSKYESLLSEVQSLKNALDQRDKDTMQAQIDSLKADVGKKETSRSLTDTQYTEGVKKDIEEIRVNAVSDVLDKVAKPLMEMQANQSRIQTAMMISELERSRNAPAGSYAQMFSGTVTDTDVENDLSRWKERAERARP